VPPLAPPPLATSLTDTVIVFISNKITKTCWYSNCLSRPLYCRDDVVERVKHFSTIRIAFDLSLFSHCCRIVIFPWARCFMANISAWAPGSFDQTTIFL